MRVVAVFVVALGCLSACGSNVVVEYMDNPNSVSGNNDPTSDTNQTNDTNNNTSNPNTSNSNVLTPSPMTEFSDCGVPTSWGYFVAYPVFYNAAGDRIVQGYVADLNNFTWGTIFGANFMANQVGTAGWESVAVVPSHFGFNVTVGFDTDLQFLYVHDGNTNTSDVFDCSGDQNSYGPGQTMPSETMQDNPNVILNRLADTTQYAQQIGVW